MFSSNQKLEVSGDFGTLASALGFALSLSGNHSNIGFQTTNDGKYCIGWIADGDKNGWQQYQFDFDVSIVAKIIIQYLQKQKDPSSGYEYFDGSTSGGYLMKAIPNTFEDEYKGIKNPFYGIVSFEKFTNFYSK